ncbi:MAG: hypothetical protein K2X47_19550, partial [Bdellovibrionales bacterium]|nr:hypothetical protein [Bdellovibrionales bacterium]
MTHQRLWQAVLLPFIVYFFASCQLAGASICTDLAAPILNAQAEHRFDEFFLKTRRFANLVGEANGFDIDMGSPEYLSFVTGLKAAVGVRLGAIEHLLGQEEAVSISTAASPGDVVIKFNRSKTHF